MKSQRWNTILILALVWVLLLPLSSLAAEHTARESQVDKSAIEEIMDQMTVEEKVGQLFVIHVYGKTPTDPHY